MTVRESHRVKSSPAAVNRRPPRCPRGEAFAEIVARHQRRELFALDLQPFGDAMFKPRVTAVMMPPIASGECLTMRAARSRAADNRSSCGTTRLISPISRARAGVNGSPVSSSSSARLRPASRGSRWVPPKVGGMPRLISGLANIALSLAMARCTASVISQPPPNASPLIAAMTGFLKASSRAVIPCPRRTKSRIAVSAPRRTLRENSWMSAPAENARSPAPVRMTARTPVSTSMQVEHGHQPVDQLVVQCVEPVRPVQRDKGDPVFDVE